MKPKITKYEENIISIARHYIWADKMKEKFAYVLKRDGIPKIDPMWYTHDVFLYMALWYSFLFEVLKTLKKKNIRIPSVQEEIEKYYSILGDFRNATFHIEGELHPKKFYKVLKQGEESAEKIRKISDEIGKFLQNFICKIIDKPMG